MYADRFCEGRFTSFSRARVQLKNGTEAILDDVYMEANARFMETYTCVGDYDGFWWFEMEPITPNDITYAEHDDYEVEKVLEIITEDWQLQEEWEREYA